MLTTIRGTGIGNFHSIEKEKGIEYLYAWLNKHPNVHAVVIM